MGIANRIINILVLLAAIGAIVLSFLLFQKREDITLARKMMADAIAKNTSALTEKEADPKSKSKYAVKTADFSIDKPADKLKSPLDRFNNATKNALKIRSELADYIVAMTEVVLDDKREDSEFLSAIKSASLEDTYLKEDECNKIKDRVSDRITRNNNTKNAFFASLVTLTKQLQLPELDESKFSTKPEGIEYAKQAAEDIGKKGVASLEKNVVLTEHVRKVSDIIKVPTPSLDDDGYASALKEQRDSLEKHMQLFEETIQEKERLTKEVEGLNNKVKEQETVIAAEKKKSADLEKKLAAKVKEVQRLRDIITPKTKKVTEEEAAMANAKANNAPSNYNFLKQLQAKVIFVNAKLGFVVVDFGTSYKVETTDDKGVKKQNSVQFPPNAVMTVATSLEPQKAHFHGKIQLVKVGEKESVANILPTPNHDLPSVGDIVYFSSYDLESIRLANEKRLKEAQEKMEKEAAALQAALDAAAPKSDNDKDADEILGNDEEKSDAKSDSKKADDESDEDEADDKQADDKKADSKKADADEDEEEEE